jgi:hypothetical protein
MIKKCKSISKIIYASIGREFHEDDLVSYKLNIHWDNNNFEETVSQLMEDIQTIGGGTVIDVKHNTVYCSADIDYNYKCYNPVLDVAEPEKFPYMIYNALVIYEE